jgi:hypothetical protein
MPHISYVLALFIAAQASADHTDNPIYQELIANGLIMNGTKVSLPSPTLPDGPTADSARAAVKAVAGDDRAVKELLRNSVTAPFILKTRDLKAGDAIVRVADLWFVVHARLEDVDLDQAIRVANDQTVEVANMRLECKLLNEQDLREQKIEPLPPREHRKEWFTHITSRLLDRIEVEATDRADATRSSDSIVIAARTDHAFDSAKRFSNRWASLTRKGQEKTTGPERSYDGGASYVKMTKLPNEPGALFVEAHFVYVEPYEWFQGNPILRSKFGVIAQDQIRRLRREIETKRNSK